MKLFAVILSVYILVLTAIPCVDIPGDEHASQKVQQTQIPSHHHHHEGDTCSPFCTCKCCSTVVVVQEYAVHFACFSFTLKPYSTYSSDYVSSVYPAIWQPPKIG